MYANAELAVGNIARRVLHIIREEDLSLATAAIAGLELSGVSDDEDDVQRDDYPVLSAAAVAAAARSTLRPPSLQTLLEDAPIAAAIPHTSSSGGDSEGKSRCEYC
jgi:translation initiation factor eIF-2B subunit beta